MFDHVTLSRDVRSKRQISQSHVQGNNTDQPRLHLHNPLSCIAVISPLHALSCTSSTARKSSTSGRVCKACHQSKPKARTPLTNHETRPKSPSSISRQSSKVLDHPPANAHNLHTAQWTRFLRNMHSIRIGHQSTSIRRDACRFQPHQYASTCPAIIKTSATAFFH